MVNEEKIILSNSVEVKFYPEEMKRERFLEISKSPDFLQETNTAKEVGCFPPMNLLVYDDVMALGLYSEGNVYFCVRPYTDELLLQWVDTALSLRKHPIRVVEKTSVSGEMLRRLKPRIDLDWIEYDPATQVVREIRGKICPAQRYLESMHANKELYTLVEDKGVEVGHILINDRYMGNGIMAEGQYIEHHDKPIDDVEKMVRESHPNALVVRLPLLYCDLCIIEEKPWSCLAHVFEKVYADKMGLECLDPLVPQNYGLDSISLS